MGYSRGLIGCAEAFATQGSTCCPWAGNHSSYLRFYFIYTGLGSSTLNKDSSKSYSANSLPTFSPFLFPIWYVSIHDRRRLAMVWNRTDEFCVLRCSRAACGQILEGKIRHG